MGELLRDLCSYVCIYLFLGASSSGTSASESESSGGKAYNGRIGGEFGRSGDDGCSPKRDRKAICSGSASPILSSVLAARPVEPFLIPDGAESFLKLDCLEAFRYWLVSRSSPLRHSAMYSSSYGYWGDLASSCGRRAGEPGRCCCGNTIEWT